MHLSGIFIYPVKSLRGLAVDSAALDALGLVGDRRFMIVDDDGRFLTQRTLPRMALATTALEPTHLIVSASGYGTLRVPLVDAAASHRAVTVWKSEGLLADDCGPAASAWCTEFLGVKAHLVRVGAAFHRPVLKPGRARPDDLTGFADLFPFLLLSEASLHDLNARLVAVGEPALPVDRFRTNLLVSGCPSYAEDTWGSFRIGAIDFRIGGPCARCAITTTDQLTGERGKEPLRTLATYRRDATDPTRIDFGQNVFHETKSGILRVGDEVILGPR
jgi:uncharacterized protein YcbX